MHVYKVDYRSTVHPRRQRSPPGGAVRACQLPPRQGGPGGGGRWQPDPFLPEGLGGHTYAGFKEFVTEAVNSEFQERAE